MNTRIYILSLAAVFLLGGCENVINDPLWPEYEEQLVVLYEATIQDDSVFIACNVSRTVPLWEPFTDESFWIDTAAVFTYFDGEAHALKQAHRGDAFIGAFSLPENTSTLGFTAEWNGLHTYGDLDIVNAQIALDTSWVVDWGFYRDAYIRFTPIPEKRFTYLLRYEVYNTVYNVWQFADILYITGPTGNSYRATYNEDGSIDVRLNEYGTSAPGARRIAIDVISEGWYWKNEDDNNGYEDSFELAFISHEPKHYNVKGDALGYMYYTVSGEYIEIGN